MGRNNDAPRVVGFDFGAPGAPAGAPPDAPPAYQPPHAPAAPPPPAYPPPSGGHPQPAYAAPAAAPAYAAPGYAPPAPAYAAPGYAPPAPGYAAPAQPDYGYAAAPTQPDYGYAAAPAQPDYGYAAAPAQQGYGGPGFALPGYAAPGGPPQWAPPGYAGSDAPAYQPPKERMGLISVGGAIRLVVVVAVAYGGVKGAMRAISPPKEMPKSLNGVPLDNSAQARRATAEMEKAVSRVHAVNSAAYGDSNGTVYLLLAGDSDDKSGRGIYDEYVRDIKKDGGRSSRPQTFDGITCTTTTLQQGSQFSVCFWGGAKSDGFVVELVAGPLDELALVTAEARDAINR